jgi:4-amino-4-deoxy-L-arabinose transferase-like glycosyltransferase
VLGAAALLLLPGLSVLDLWAPDEPRYAEIAEELRALPHGSADLVLLRLNGEAYTQKPPLYFWLAAGLGSLQGRVTELAARLPSALAGIACIGLTLVLGRLLLSRSAAVLGAALLLTSFEFTRAARRAHLDILLSLFEILALLAFWRLDQGLGRRRLNLALLHGAMGLAVLTKGPVGFLVPLAVIVAYLAWERRLGQVGRVLPLWGLALSLGPGLAWLAAATWLAPPGYFAEAVGENVFGRFFAGTSHARPFYYFAYQLPLDFLPWTLLLPGVYWAARRDSRLEQSSWRFLLAWVAASFVFFSLSSGKRGNYLFPTFPALALLCADALLRLLAARARLPGVLRISAGVLGGVVVVAAAVLLFTPLEGRMGLADWHRTVFASAAIAVVVVSTGLWFGCSRADAPRTAYVTILVASVFAIELAAFQLLLPGLDRSKSPRPAAVAAAELTTPGHPIGLVGDRALVGGLRYYGGRPVLQLDSPDRMRAFVEAGGRAIVVKERKLRHLEGVVSVREHARFREGSRTLLVVTPLDGG